MKTREWSNFILFYFISKLPFWTYIFKNQHIHFWVHGHLIHIWFTNSEGSKGLCKLIFLRNRTMEEGLISWSMV